MFTAIFVSLFVVVWLLCGALTWLSVSFWTRGGAGLWMLPLCMVSAVTGGLAIPLLVRDDGIGIWMSIAAAFLLPSALMSARYLARAPITGNDRVESTDSEAKA
ncbi:MAG TPA: hypothetical protein QGF35_02775 [Dehalococcoidia bacterium]|nr:hypothetical protein [Dehalococcoidia bacterium]